MIRSLQWLMLLALLLPLTGATTMPADSFTAGSVWMGTELGDPRRPRAPQARSRPAKLNVLERKDATFNADYGVAGAAVHLEGKIDPHGQIIARVTRVMRGEWGPHVLETLWNGNVSGEQMTLSYTMANNLVQTIELTLDESGKSHSGTRKRN